MTGHRETERVKEIEREKKGGGEGRERVPTLLVKLPFSKWGHGA